MSVDGRADSTARNSIQDVEKGLKDHGVSEKIDSTTKELEVEAGIVEKRSTKDSEEVSEPADPNIVDWDGDNDPQNPMNWTTRKKWTMIVLISAVTFDTSMAVTIFAPGVPYAQAEFNNNNGAEASLLVSVYIIGLAIGPLFLTPLSEHYGRTPVVNVSNVAFLIATILCAVAVNLPMLIIFRLFMGLACSVSITIGGGFIADLIERERRGRALSMWIIGPLMGPVIGPIAGGYLSLDVNWRWTFWLIAIVSGVITIACFLLLRETYGPKLLLVKAERLRKETGSPKLKSKLDKGQTPGQLFRLAIIRPAKLIVRSPIVLVLSIFISVAYSYTYLLFATYVRVFEGQYGFNSGEAGLAYLGMAVGFLIGQFSAGSFSDWYLARQKARLGRYRPEDRLPPMLVGSLFLPIGLFIYGWTAEYHVHWIAPIVGTGFCGVGIMYVFLPIQLYFVDAFNLYAASAVAANTVVRSVFGTCIPLAAPALYARLGLGWGNSLLGFLALLCAPAALLIIKYGERIRQNPRFQPDL